MNILEQLKQTADQIKKIRPAYQTILDFYSQVFMAQEQSKQTIILPPIVIKSDLLKIKHKHQMPLIDQSEFIIDQKESLLLFEKITDLAEDLAPRLSASAKVLKTCLKDPDFDIETLFFAILNNQTSVLHDLSGRLQVPENEIVFFGYASMIPSIQLCAEQLGTYLDQTWEVKKGYCPVCGNHPDMAFLDKDGKRHLKCCFCAHEWDVKRMGCVFCENNDKDMQQYFFSDEEKEYRVNLCDHCHNYIKVVDLRQMDRAFYPNLELISTLHLDLKAREKGYTNGDLPSPNIYH